MASNCKLKKRTSKQLPHEEEQSILDGQKMCERALGFSSHISYFFNSWPFQKTDKAIWVFFLR